MDLKTKIVDALGHVGSQAVKAAAEKAMESISTSDIIAAVLKPKDEPAKPPEAAIRPQDRWPADMKSGKDDTSWLPMDRAPKDGTFVILLLDARKGSHTYPLEHGALVRSLGHNNRDNDGKDAWRIVGWDWATDSFRNAEGVPVAWTHLPVAAKAVP